MIERIMANMPEGQAQSDCQVRSVRESARMMNTERGAILGAAAGVVVVAIGWVHRRAIVHFSSMAAGDAGQRERQ